MIVTMSGLFNGIKALTIEFVHTQILTRCRSIKLLHYATLAGCRKELVDPVAIDEYSCR